MKNNIASLRDALERSNDSATADIISSSMKYGTAMLVGAFIGAALPQGNTEPSNGGCPKYNPCYAEMAKD